MRVRGVQPSQYELLGKGLEFLERHQDEFLAESTWRPLSREDLQALRRKQGHYGKWSVKDLDELVYGEAG